MIVPGLVSVTCKRSSAEEIITYAKTLGLLAIEWSENWHIQADDLQRAGEIGRLTRASGLVVAGYGSYFRLGTGLDPTPSIKAAAQMQAPVIRIWGGDKPSNQVSDGAYRLLVAETKAVADLAGEYQLQVALEWHKNTITDTNETAATFLADVGRSNLKTLWQPHQNLTVQQRLEGLCNLKKAVQYLHVYHWDEQGRRPLEEGTDEWMQYLAAFKSSESKFALLEFVKGDSLEQLKNDAHTLIAWIEKNNQIGERNGQPIQ